MNALEICGICAISVEMKNSADIYSHTDFTDLTDFLFRCYYVVHECTIDLRNQRGKEKLSGDILTQISLISQIFYSDIIILRHRYTINLCYLRCQRENKTLT